MASDWLEHHHDWKTFHALASLCGGFQVSVLSKFSDVYFNFQRIVTNKKLDSLEVRGHKEERLGRAFTYTEQRIRPAPRGAVVLYQGEVPGS